MSRVRGIVKTVIGLDYIAGGFWRTLSTMGGVLCS
jgi:hypothetical protein